MATSVSFPLLPGKGDVEFRFTISSARQLDKAAGSGLSALLSRGQTTEALVLMTCYGLKHAIPTMTEQKAERWIDAFIENGGDTTELFQALFRAVSLSGVYGKVEAEDQATETEENPPMPATKTA
jgi:hypothetical protein